MVILNSGHKVIFNGVHVYMTDNEDLKTPIIVASIPIEKDIPRKLIYVCDEPIIVDNKPNLKVFNKLAKHAHDYIVKLVEEGFVPQDFGIDYIEMPKDQYEVL